MVMLFLRRFAQGNDEIADFPCGIKQLRPLDPQRLLDGISSAPLGALSMTWALCHNGSIFPAPSNEEPEMKKSTLSVLIIVASSAIVPAALAQDAEAGKASFNKCMACHSIGEGAK